MKYLFQKFTYKKFCKGSSLSGFKKRSSNGETIGNDDISVSILWTKSNTTDFILISIDALYIPLEISNPIYKLLS